MKQCALNYINNTLLRQANKLLYTVSHNAPGTEIDLFNSTSLVIWSGASDKTIFSDCRVNWAFRALHDTLHLQTRLDFRPETEIYIGRLQASLYDSDLVRELIYSEASLQAEYYLNNGHFIDDQYNFTLNHLLKTGVIK
jgi:hypothetical protein